MAELTEWWIDRVLVNGRSVIKVTAAMGEGPDLSDTNGPKCSRGGRGGAGRGGGRLRLKTTGTYQASKTPSARKISARSACRSICRSSHQPTQDDYVRYFTDISDAVDIGILIYNTWWFGVPRSRRKR